jgi:hypothetical protein
MSLVIIKSYELLKKTYEEVKAAKAARDAEAREASSKKKEVTDEVATAQTAMDDLLDRAIAGEDLATEIAQAKSRVTVAEAKKSRIEAKQQATVANVKPKVGFLTVDSEIHNQIGDGRIIEVFQPDLDELNELRGLYRKKVQDVLVKMHFVNKELNAVHSSAAQMEGELTGKSVDTRPTPQLTESNFRPWIWLGQDLPTEMHTIMNIASQTAYQEHALPPVKYPPDASKAGMSDNGMTPQEYIKFNQNLVRG